MSVNDTTAAQSVARTLGAKQRGAGVMTAHPFACVVLDPALEIAYLSDAVSTVIAESSLTSAIASLASAAQGNDVDVHEVATPGLDGARRRMIWTKAIDGAWLGVVASAATSAPNDEIMMDALTGLGSRRGLQGNFDALMLDADTQGDAVFALYIDLDRFKQVNDTLGHEAGDLLLKRVSKRLRQATRRSDRLFRLGGDEFALLGYSPEGIVTATDVAERIVELVGRPYLIKGSQVSIGASVGVALIQEGDSCAEDLLRRADIALYESKNRGRGRFTTFHASMLTELNQRRLLENDLRRALLLEQFELHFQPQIVLDSDKLTGFEALIRWRRPGHGLVPPSGFVPLAEETGLIIGIGEWVLMEAARTATTWPEDVSVAVNVSAIEFESPDFIDTVHKALSVTQLAPHRLELELTETVIVRDNKLVLDRMNELREIGVLLSMDDFGAGQSSLGYLRRFPFHKIKIDQSFVRGAKDGGPAHEIVGAIAELGKSLGMSVLAEGVESDKQLNVVRDYGCSGVQGFVVSKPMPANAIAAYLGQSQDEAAQEEGPTDPADSERMPL